MGQLKQGPGDFQMTIGHAKRSRSVAFGIKSRPPSGEKREGRNRIRVPVAELRNRDQIQDCSETQSESSGVNSCTAMRARDLRSKERRFVPEGSHERHEENAVRS